MMGPARSYFLPLLGRIWAQDGRDTRPMSAQYEVHMGLV